MLEEYENVGTEGFLEKENALCEAVPIGMDVSNCETVYQTFL